MDHTNIFYVNGEYNGDDVYGRLMHDFLCSDPEKMYNTIIAGIAEGKIAGIAEGYLQCSLDSLRNIMKTLRIPAEEAMNILEIPEANRSKLLAEL